MRSVLQSAASRGRASVDSYAILISSWTKSLPNHTSAGKLCRKISTCAGIPDGKDIFHFNSVSTCFDLNYRKKSFSFLEIKRSYHSGPSWKFSVSVGIVPYQRSQFSENTWLIGAGVASAQRANKLLAFLIPKRLISSSSRDFRSASSNANNLSSHISIGVHKEKENKYKQGKMGASGPWSTMRRAFLTTLRNRKAVLVFGGCAAGAGILASQTTWGNSFFSTRNQHLHSALCKGKDIVEKRVRSRRDLEETETDTKTLCSSENVGLVLVSGACMIPHPDKIYRGGEDAYFASEVSSCIGVADGVGGWAEVGVDPGLYSRELMKRAQQFTEELPKGPGAPQDALEAAHAATQARGSSTACLVCLYKGQLHASNLGDSGFMVVRQGEVAFMSPQQQHEFNFPYQIGSPDSMGDLPQAAQRFVIEVQPGDIVLAATDGVFDNVYPDEAASIVAAAKEKGESPVAAATALAHFARTRAEDETHLSPFAYGAQQLGFRYFGGKLDDITVVCSYIEEKQDLPGEDQQNSAGERVLGTENGEQKSGAPRNKL